jgi:hypothetical protein
LIKWNENDGSVEKAKEREELLMKYYQNNDVDLEFD